MTKFDPMKGVFGLLPTPYTEDLDIHTADLQATANFCCESGQHGIGLARHGRGVLFPRRGGTYP